MRLLIRTILKYIVTYKLIQLKYVKQYITLHTHTKIHSCIYIDTYSSSLKMAR